MAYRLDELLQVDHNGYDTAFFNEFGKTKSEVNDCIQIIKEWLPSQQHLPEIPSDKLIHSFLLWNKFNVESAKEKIDMYYTIRSLMPEYYRNRHPTSAAMIENSKFIIYLALPKPVNKYERVVYVKVMCDVEQYDIDHLIKLGINTLEAIYEEDVAFRTHLIYDCEHVRPGHIVKVGVMALKKSAFILEKVYSNRISAIHLINVPSYMDTLISLCKSVLSPKIASRVHVHKSVETLFEVIPKEVLPKDIGGDEISLNDLNELWRKKFASLKDRFDKLEKFQVNESLRPAPLVNDDVLGWHGNFRKLCVD